MMLFKTDFQSGWHSEILFDQSNKVRLKKNQEHIQLERKETKSKIYEENASHKKTKKVADNKGTNKNNEGIRRRTTEICTIKAITMESKQEKRRIQIIMVCISTHSTHSTRRNLSEGWQQQQKNWIRMSEAASTLRRCDQFKRIVIVCVSRSVAHATHCHTIKIEYTLLIFSRIHLYLNRTAPQRTIFFLIQFFPVFVFSHAPFHAINGIIILA